ncbi:TAXI family TRAP transporter solute-binding subunit [Oceanobacillus polygoni]|uniref:TRAP transporter TAXI family solute receptor n=1 Tax=Oceanobacillus polygoni TaxID=1235259 RepID=A0A9X0YNR5_9BACI|nr:TAXI family TRAP transporter solute-binding subunit [Oceanobacillus polygoni]MBP2076037.1 TRAP transporter TAXI family solute receptor [Oceanobacillus polygoni]
MVRKLKRYSLYLSIVIATGILVACGSASADRDEGFISFGAHQSGSAYHSAATGLAKVVSDKSDLKLTVKPFSGPNAWMPLLNSGEIDLGILAYPDAGWAYVGENGYPKKNKNIRTLVNGNDILVSGLTVRVDSGIKEISDLKGKRVASDYTGNQILPNILEAHLASAGLSWDDVVSVPVTDINTGVNALRENRVDAIFAGTPTVGIFTEMDTTKEIDVLDWAEISPENIDDFPEETIEEMTELVPGISPVAFEGGILKNETTIVSYPIILATNSHISEDVAYNVVKTLWNNYEELHKQYMWLETWNPENMFDDEPAIPYHSGAVKFFKEVGVWTDIAEENQQELLNQFK